MEPQSGQESGRARGPEDAHGEWHRGSWGCWDAAAVRAPCPREGRPCQAPLVPSQHQSQLLPWGGCSADPRGSPAPEQPWAPPLLRGQGRLYPGGGCSWRVLSSGAPASGLASPPQVREATGLVSFFKPTPSNVLKPMGPPKLAFPSGPLHRTVLPGDTSHSPQVWLPPICEPQHQHLHGEGPAPCLTPPTVVVGSGCPGCHRPLWSEPSTVRSGCHRPLWPGEPHGKACVPPILSRHRV